MSAFQPTELLRLQTAVFGPQRLWAFDMLRVDGDAGHRADLNALGLVKMADAFGAFGRIDLIDLWAQVNRLVGALGLTDIAVDAFIGDHQRHTTGSRRFGFKLMGLIIGHAQQPAGQQGCWRHRVFVPDPDQP